MMSSVRTDQLAALIAFHFDLELLLRRRELHTIKTRLAQAQELRERLADAILQTPDTGAVPAQGESAPTRSQPPDVLYGLLSTGVFIKWVCPQCQRTDFASVAGMRIHCRVAHHRVFSSVSQMAHVCGVPVPENEVPPDDPCRDEPLAFIELTADELAASTDSAYLSAVQKNKEELDTLMSEIRQRASIKVFDEDVELSSAGSAGSSDADSGSDTDGEATGQRGSKLAHAMSSARRPSIAPVPTGEPAPTAPAPAPPPAPVVSRPLSSDARLAGGSRFYMTKNVIVGNTSRFIPPERRTQSATHKWTVYVCGLSNDIDIATYVKKVRFYLHPSYAPNDMVDVIAPPFSLRRLGWGEFPVRVQLHFADPKRNKPVDIIHMLKLDANGSGREVLGAEKLYEVELDRAMLAAVPVAAPAPDKPSESSGAAPAAPAPAPPSVPGRARRFDPSEPWPAALLASRKPMPDVLFEHTARVFPLAGRPEEPGPPPEYSLLPSLERFAQCSYGRRKAIEYRRAAQMLAFVKTHWRAFKRVDDVPVEGTPLLSSDIDQLTTLAVMRWCRATGATPAEGLQYQPLPPTQPQPRDAKPAPIAACKRCGDSTHPATRCRFAPAETTVPADLTSPPAKRARLLTDEWSTYTPLSRLLDAARSRQPAANGHHHDTAVPNGVLQRDPQGEALVRHSVAAVGIGGEHGQMAPDAAAAAWAVSRQFLRDLVRASIATLHEQHRDAPDARRKRLCLTPAHVHRAAAAAPLFDFLTNVHMQI